MTLANTRKPKLTEELDICSPPFYIKSVNNGLVLAACQNQDGGLVSLVAQEFDESAAGSQLWQWKSNGCIQNYQSKHLLSVIQSSNDKENEYSVVTVPSQHENTNTNTDTESASHWTLSDRHFLTFLNYNKCLGIDEKQREFNRLTLVAQSSPFAWKWNLEFLSLPFFIRNRATGLVMDVYYKHREPGTPVILFRQKLNPFFNSNQLWRFRLNGAIESIDSGLVLDASTRTNKLVVYTHYDAPNQRQLP